MTRFQLAWDDTWTGRARVDGDSSARPLVWFWISWGEGHAVRYVDVYGDGAACGATVAHTPGDSARCAGFLREGREQPAVNASTGGAAG